MSQAEFKKRLKALMNKPENQVCSDCPERQPRWASLIVPPPGSPPGALPMGAFCCLECSGSHRRLGVHISFVRSVNLDQWKEHEVLAMENGGNKKVNAIFEARMNNYSGAKPDTHASGPVRERFIRDKYERRKYFDQSVLQSHYAGNTESSSEEETSSDEDDGPSRPPPKPVNRTPSDAARMRAENRRNRLAASRNSVSTTKTSGVNKKVTRPPNKKPASKPPPPPPEVDLLDFGMPMSDPGPPPNPPSAAPSPTLDLFKDMNISSQSSNQAAGTNSSDNSNNNNSQVPSGGSGVQFEAASNAATEPQEPKKMSSAQILAMFSTPSPAVQGGPSGFGAFRGAMNNNGMVNNDRMAVMGGNSNANANNNNMMMGNNMGNYSPNVMGNNMVPGKPGLMGNAGMNNNTANMMVGNTMNNNMNMMQMHKLMMTQQQQNKSMVRGVETGQVNTGTMMNSHTRNNGFLSGNSNNMNMNMNMNMNGIQQQSSQHNNFDSTANMNGMMMPQPQQMPMGGTHSNLNVMGGTPTNLTLMGGTGMGGTGAGMGLPGTGPGSGLDMKNQNLGFMNQQMIGSGSFGGNQLNNQGMGMMGGGATTSKVKAESNPQQDQFAQFSNFG